jgi:hypothetical protein
MKLQTPNRIAGYLGGISGQSLTSLRWFVGANAGLVLFMDWSYESYTGYRLKGLSSLST